MLGSYTSGPNGAFLAYLRQSAPEKDRVDWLAVDRSIAAAHAGSSFCAGAACE